MPALFLWKNALTFHVEKVPYLGLCVRTYLGEVFCGYSGIFLLISPFMENWKKLSQNYHRILFFSKSPDKRFFLSRLPKIAVGHVAF